MPVRCKECDEQDLGVTLDRVPDRRLHVAGHADEPVFGCGREKTVL
jgi:hypothetical protein